MSEKVILVVSMDGYPKHGLDERVRAMFDANEPHGAWMHRGYGYHQYYYNSEGWQLMYFTNYSIPDSTNDIDVWSHIWNYEEELEGSEFSGHEIQFSKPYEFEVDGQKYKYIGRIHGYNHDSTDPSDERYEA